MDPYPYADLSIIKQIVRKTSIPTVLLLPFDFFIFEK
jgi:hypothetical protein